jgi:hypothetical protein
MRAAMRIQLLIHPLKKQINEKNSMKKEMVEQQTRTLSIFHT